MKKIAITTLGALCLLCACHIDPNASSTPATEIENQSLDDWQKTADEIAGSIKQQYINICLDDKAKATKAGAFDKLNELIDPENADQAELIPFPLYTIDTALWTTQPDLTLDAYLKLRPEWIGFYLLYQGQLNARITAEYDEKNDNPWHVSTVIRPVDDSYLQEKTLISQNLATGEPIIGLTFPKNSLACFVYIKQNGKWQRVSGGLMEENTGDVVKDLRNNTPYNRWIMRK